MPKIAVIGAGIAGLTIAQQLYKLHDRNLSVHLFDKGRGVGGRMSSRRTNWGYLDHGCQYFTVRNNAFRDFLTTYKEIIVPWQGNFTRWEDNKLTPVTNDKLRYVPPTAMNRLCKSLAVNLDVKLNTRIVRLVKIGAKWTLNDENNHQYHDYDWVIVTAPPQQTVDLLNNHTDLVEQINSIQMLPCYSLMLILKQKIDLAFDGMELVHPRLGWIAANHSKPQRESFSSLIIQSNFTWTIDHLNTNRDLVTEQIKASTQEILQIPLDNCHYQSLHLWRYAIPAEKNNQGYYLDTQNTIAVCGDWCLKGKVESAFLSANLLAQKLNFQS